MASSSSLRAEDGGSARDEWGGLLAPGERVVWAERPGPPRALRALGLPPRSPAHLLALALAATALVAAALLAPHQRGPARLALALAAGLPLASVAALAAWATWRRRRTRFALTDRGRALVARGGEVWAFAATPPPAALPAGEYGTIEWGERQVHTAPGGHSAPRQVRFEDVAYPQAALALLADSSRRGSQGA